MKMRLFFSFLHLLSPHASLRLGVKPFLTIDDLPG